MFCHGGTENIEKRKSVLPCLCGNKLYLMSKYVCMKKPFKYRKLLQYFLQGLLILAPVAITAYSIYWVVSSIDSWLPIFTYLDKNGLVHVRNYGLGFVI